MVETNKEELNWELDLNPTKSEHLPIGNSPHFVTYTQPTQHPDHTTTKDLVIVLNTRFSAEYNVVSVANKARRMPFYMKRSFAALTPSIFLPLYKTFIRPHLEYAIQATHPILCRDAEALEKVQKLALKFVKGLRHVPCEAALKQLRLFSLTHRRIRGDLIAMFKFTHGRKSNPQRATRPRLQVPQTDVERAVANSPLPFGLSHFGTNYRLR